jgi:hypothetical protein
LESTSSRIGKSEGGLNKFGRSKQRHHRVVIARD